MKHRKLIKPIVFAGLVSIALAMCAMPIILRPHGKLLRKFAGSGPGQLSLEVRTYDRRNHKYLFSFKYNGPPHGMSYLHQGVSYNLLNLSEDNHQGFRVSTGDGETEYELGALFVRRSADRMFVFYGSNPHDFNPSAATGDSVIIDGIELKFGSSVDVEALFSAMGMTETMLDWHTGMD